MTRHWEGIVVLMVAMSLVVVIARLVIVVIVVVIVVVVVMAALWAIVGVSSSVVFVIAFVFVVASFTTCMIEGVGVILSLCPDDGGGLAVVVLEIHRLSEVFRVVNDPRRIDQLREVWISRQVVINSRQQFTSKGLSMLQRRCDVFRHQAMSIFTAVVMNQTETIAFDFFLGQFAIALLGFGGFQVVHIDEWQQYYGFVVVSLAIQIRGELCGIEVNDRRGRIFHQKAITRWQQRRGLWWETGQQLLEWSQWHALMELDLLPGQGDICWSEILVTALGVLR